MLYELRGILTLRSLNSLLQYKTYSVYELFDLLAPWCMNSLVYELVYELLGIWTPLYMSFLVYVPFGVWTPWLTDVSVLWNPWYMNSLAYELLSIWTHWYFDLLDLFTPLCINSLMYPFVYELLVIWITNSLVQYMNMTSLVYRICHLTHGIQSCRVVL